MTDDQRRAFSNLILLCTQHHRWVDRLHPDDYPAEMLLEWKAQREADAGIDQSVLTSITDDDLLALIERVVAAMGGPKREALVEIGMGFAGSKVLVLKTETAKAFIDSDDYKDWGPKALILTLRNSGSLPITWEGASVEFAPSGGGMIAESGVWFRNPLLPLRIESGDSARWFFNLPLLTKMVAFFRQRGQQVDALVGKARLASGETVESSPLPTENLPDWSD